MFRSFERPPTHFRDNESSIVKTKSYEYVLNEKDRKKEKEW